MRTWREPGIARIHWWQCLRLDRPLDACVGGGGVDSFREGLQISLGGYSIFVIAGYLKASDLYSTVRLFGLLEKLVHVG